jgi:hypothetical protein
MTLIHEGINAVRDIAALMQADNPQNCWQRITSKGRLSLPEQRLCSDS